MSRPLPPTALADAVELATQRPDLADLGFPALATSVVTG